MRPDATAYGSYLAPSRAKLTFEAKPFAAEHLSIPFVDGPLLIWNSGLLFLLRGSYSLQLGM